MFCTVKHFCKLQHTSVFTEVSVVQHLIIKSWLLCHLLSQAVTNTSIELYNRVWCTFFFGGGETESQKKISDLSSFIYYWLNMKACSRIWILHSLLYLIYHTFLLQPVIETRSCAVTIRQCSVNGTSRCCGEGLGQLSHGLMRSVRSNIHKEQQIFFFILTFMVVRWFWCGGTSLLPAGHFLVFFMFLLGVCQALEHCFSCPQASVSLHYWCLCHSNPHPLQHLTLLSCRQTLPALYISA